MQETSVEHLPNKGGWYIKHDADENMFQIVAANGTKLAGKYTKRKFAEMALKLHLDGNSKPIVYTRKKEKKAS